MRALVTGAGGFAGSHLVEHLVAQEWSVVASDLEAPQAPDGVDCVPLDVTDGQACWNLLTDCRPDAIFHLAGMAHVARAESEPERCLAVNAGGSRNMLEACLDGHANVRFLLASSAEVYGRVAPEELPVTEDQPLRPATVYAASKASAEMSLHHAVARGLHAVVCRAFNHIGPRQSEDFVASAFARQVACIEAGRQEPVIHVGNLSAIRDLSDVRDVVADYVLCLEHGRPGDVFNVTSGTAVAIQRVLDVLVGLATTPVTVEVDPTRLRPVDVPVFHGSPERLRACCGHTPRLDLEQTLAEVLDYWRARVGREPAR